jgi:hypothetical protein
MKALPIQLIFLRMILLFVASVATALSASITLELSGGSVIKGDLVFWKRATGGR